MSIFEKIFDSVKLMFNIKTSDNSSSIRAVGNISAGRDIIINHDSKQQYSKRPKLDLDGGMSVSGGPSGNWINLRLVNRGDASALDIKYYFSFDDKEMNHIDGFSNLTPGSKTINKECHYRETEIFEKEVSDLRINLIYKDADGKLFHSGRKLKQEKRSDGYFNIEANLGEYFDKIADEKETTKPENYKELSSTNHRSRVMIIMLIFLVCLSIAYLYTGYSFSKGLLIKKDNAQVNIANILEKDSTLTKSLDHDNFLNKYNNTNVYGKGIFLDLSKPDDKYMVTIGVSNNSVTCWFDESFEKQLLLLRNGQEINFTGLFRKYPGMNIHGNWIINDCSLI